MSGTNIIIPGTNGTQITSTQRAAHLEWYILFNCKHNIFYLFTVCGLLVDLHF